MPQVINGSTCYIREEAEVRIQEYIEKSADDLYKKLIMKKNSVL